MLLDKHNHPDNHAEVYKPCFLGINVDHVATLRNARGTHYPDPLEAALQVQQAGANNITVHLREDRRHIRETDLFMLKEALSIPLNLEMAATPEMLSMALKVKPAYVCLVPERREELTTEGGLAVDEHQDILKTIIGPLKEAGIRVSLFIDPTLASLETSVELGVHAVELHTGAYAQATLMSQEAKALKTDPAYQAYQAIKQAVQQALKLGLLCDAGHGLTIDNVKAIAAIPGIHTLNIGHAIVARALFIGLKEAVVEMKSLIMQAR